MGWVGCGGDGIARHAGVGGGYLVLMGFRW